MLAIFLLDRDSLRQVIKSKSIKDFFFSGASIKIFFFDGGEAVDGFVLYAFPGRDVEEGLDNIVKLFKFE
jgi:hypothetical protein